MTSTSPTSGTTDNYSLPNVPNPYAVLLQVNIDPNSDVALRQDVLEHLVVPDLRSLPGFHLASWLNDGQGTGIILVELDTEDHARAAGGD
jgi:hypothetical protein